MGNLCGAHSLAAKRERHGAGNFVRRDAVERSLLPVDFEGVPGLVFIDGVIDIDDAGLAPHPRLHDGGGFREVLI